MSDCEKGKDSHIVKKGLFDGQSDLNMEVQKKLISPLNTKGLDVNCQEPKRPHRNQAVA